MKLGGGGGGRRAGGARAAATTTTPGQRGQGLLACPEGCHEKENIGVGKGDDESSACEGEMEVGEMLSYRIQYVSLMAVLAPQILHRRREVRRLAIEGC